MKDSDFRYLPSRPRDIQWGLHVTGAGRAAIRPGEAYPPPGHPELYQFTWKKGRSLPEFQLLFIAAGSGIFESALTGLRPVAAGTTVLLFPGVWHRYRPDTTTGWEEYWVGFAGEQMDRLVLNQFFTPEQPLLQTGPAPEIVRLFASLLDRLRDAPSGFPHLIAATVLEMLAAVRAATSAEPQQLILQGPRDVTALQDRIVAEALRLIWSGSHLQFTVGGLARQLHVTARSLERRFHAALGRTIREEIMRCRLDRVRRLLADTDLSIAEIVAVSGFSSPDALCRAVQRAEGTTPLKLRHTLRAARRERLRVAATENPNFATGVDPGPPASR